MKVERAKIEQKGSTLIRHGEAQHPGSMNLSQQLPKEQSRKRQYNSYLAIGKRDWNTLVKKPEGTEKDLQDLNTLEEEMIKTCVLNNVIPGHLDEVRKKFDGPIMIFECGFGFSTFETLKWCRENDGYLVTVELPIAPEKITKSEDYKYLYWFGVDRYWSKYQFCDKLRKNPIAKKHWLWINDDIFKVFERVVSDQDFRNKLFKNGIIHYVFEDAVHDKKFDDQMFKEFTPFMPTGSVFYSFGHRQYAFR